MRAEAYVVTHIEDPRGTRSEQLGDIFRKYTDSPVIVRENVKDALLWVLENRESRRVYCLGSLYLTGMIKELIQEVKSDAELRRRVKEV